jgi:mRNA interferase RelE/StbE
LAYRRAAARYLARVPARERRRICERLELLAADPANAALDLKPLRNRPGLRLRIGGWRVLLQRVESEQQIVVLLVRPRGDAYKK